MTTKFEWSPRQFGTAFIGDDKVYVVRKPDLGFYFHEMVADLDLGKGSYLDEELVFLLMSADQLQAVKSYLAGLSEVVMDKPSTPAVDAGGKFVGMVETGQEGAVPRPPPSPSGWIWIDDDWYEDMTLQSHKDQAHTTVDREAGVARARYITVAPGQESTYIFKAAEALIWVKDPTSTPGPFLVAEADATGLPLPAVIQQIAQVSLAWSQVIGPAVERERRRAKIAVAAASTIPQVRVALTQGLQKLSEI